MRRPSSDVRWGVAAVVVVLLALALCTVQAVAILRFRDPQPDLTATVGDSVPIDGVTYRVDTFTVSAELPAKEPGDDPVRAMADALLVQNIVTVRVDDPGVDVSGIYCFFTLVAADGRSWSSYDDAYKIAGPERVTCAASDDDPVVPGKPYRVGVVFEIPASAADGVSLQISTGSAEKTLRVHR